MKSARFPTIWLVGSLLLSPLMACGQKNLYSADLAADVVRQKRESYQSRVLSLEDYRKQKAQRLQNAGDQENAAILIECRQHLEQVLLDEIFPAWYGTDWAFSGTSRVPGEGTIACGYFVSTCLTHLGFKVNRIKLAQQPSQKIIETFMDKSKRDILAGSKPMATIKEYLRKNGDGIYIVGLDSHVGFVSVQGDDMAFIHSSYYEPGSFVKSEKIDSKNPLSDSKYRVFGKLFSDQMIIGWLEGREWAVNAR